MASQHTPGQWKAVGSDVITADFGPVASCAPIPWRAYVEEIVTLLDSISPRLAGKGRALLKIQFQQVSGGLDTPVRNARLIAKAPEMLESLKRILKAYETEGSKPLGPETYKVLPENRLGEWFRITEVGSIRALLREIEGEV